MDRRAIPDRARSGVAVDGFDRPEHGAITDGKRARECVVQREQPSEHERDSSMFDDDIWEPDDGLIQEGRSRVQRMAPSLTDEQFQHWLARPRGLSCPLTGLWTTTIT